MNCSICIILEADQTGSHIIPHFILETMLNEHGVGGRDKGLSFKLGETSSDFNFGRAVTPETLDSYLGRPVTELEIENSTKAQHHVEDHIFCSSCEKRLSYFESLYKSKVAPVIQTQKPLSIAQHQIFQFFWLSIILRCSVSKQSNFKLEEKLEEKVRIIVDANLADSPKEIEENCLKTTFPFALQVFTNVITRDKTRNSVLLHPVYKSPYLLFLNEYIVLFEFLSPSQIHEFSKHIDILIPPDDGSLGPVYVPENEWENVIHYCHDIKGKQMYRNNIERFQNAFYARHAFYPPDELTKKYMAELIGDDAAVDEASKYGEDRISKLIAIHIAAP